LNDHPAYPHSGWSTTVLNSRGTLYTAGILNKDYRYYGTESKGFRPLELPSASDESTIAIRQFSSGRSHILGLSDSGRIWSWAHKEVVGLAIKFVDVDIDEMRETASTTSTLHGKVKQVVAGWSCSSAYIYGTGIVVWDTVSLDDHGQTSIDMSCGASTDTMLVLKHSEVPRTGYQRTKDAAREGDKEMALGEEVGAVLNYILLEHFVVFVTDIGKVFCSRLGDANRIDEILELRTLRSQGGNALELQGSFRRFAVFKQYEEVITVEQSYLDACWNARTEPEHTDIEGLQWIPALQNSGVISVAFGDWHFHALHSSGKITSYGTELECCGALGLGNPEAGAPATFRGIYTGNAWAERHKGRLVPHAYTYGREVWFRPEQIAWMEYLEQGGKDGPLEEGQTSDKEAHERLNLFYNNLNVQAEVSEWIEQEGREWDKDKGEDGLGAFFALKVSAAGWHSGAIVLVNDDLASKKDVYDWLSKGFPRLKLSDGTEMPGTVDFDEWREGRPDFLRDLKISHETV
jgi:SCF-associated factor 1